MNFKKLAATLIGALMAAMPLAGSALAADYTLADFPAPFIEGGTPNFLIVIGSGGTASGIANDLAGLINVAARLGGETVSTEGEETVVTGGLKVEAPGVDFLYEAASDEISEVLPPLRDSGLPDVLADGIYDDNKGTNDKETDYTQKLTFGTTYPKVVFDVDENDDNEPAGTYLFMKSSETIYTYELKFSSDVTIDDTSHTKAKEDVQDTEIEILGKTYTINDIKLTGYGGGSDYVDELELLGGAAEATANDEEALTITLEGTEYEITPNVYAGDSVTLTVEYGGTTETTDSMDVGDTYELDDGTEVGIRDILFSTKETKTSATTFYLGAQKLTLGDGDEVKINDDTLDDYTVTATFNDNNDVLNKITITLVIDDDVWIGEGEEWVDPVFGAWKIKFTGITREIEEFEWDASGGDEATFTFTNNNGDAVEIPIGILDATTDVVSFGDPSETHFWDGSDADGEGYESDGTTVTGMITTNGGYCNHDAAITNECDDLLFLGVSAGGEAHVFRLDDVDMGNDKVKITDETLDEKLNSGEWILTTADIDTEIGGLDIDLDTTLHQVNFTTIDLLGTKKMMTAFAAEIVIARNGNNVRVTIYDGDGTNNDYIDFISDTVANPSINIDDGDITMQTYEDDSDKRVGIDNAGWGILYENSDTTEDTKVTAEYPKEKAIIDAYILESTGTISGVSDVGRTGVIKSNIAVVDTDVTSTQKSNYHLILGGGSAVNKLTAEALGLDYPTYGADSGIPEDGYMIQLIEDAFVEGQDVLVIAGWESAQTTEAMSKVQANMADVDDTVYYYPAAPETTPECTEDADCEEGETCVDGVCT